MKLLLRRRIRACLRRCARSGSTYCRVRLRNPPLARLVSMPVYAASLQIFMHNPGQATQKPIPKIKAPHNAIHAKEAGRKTEQRFLECSPCVFFRGFKEGQKKTAQVHSLNRLDPLARISHKVSQRGRAGRHGYKSHLARPSQRDRGLRKRTRQYVEEPDRAQRRHARIRRRIRKPVKNAG
jgi:hypothetical protein